MPPEGFCSIMKFITPRNTRCAMTPILAGIRNIFKGASVPETAPSRMLGPLVDAHPWIVPLALFSLSFFYRLHFMNDGLFHHDEVLLAEAVEGSLENRQLLGTINGRYGTVLLNILFYAPYKWITGNGSEKTIVFTAILSGGFLAAAIYALVLEWCRDRASGFFSSVFLSFNYLFLTTSTTGKEHTHQILFVALAFWLFHRGARTASPALKILGSASFAFALAVHESTIPLIPVFVAYIVLVNRTVNRDIKGQILDLAVLCSLLAVPFIFYLGGILYKTLTSKGSSIVSFVGLFSPILPVAMRNLFTATGIALDVLLLVGIAANVRNLHIVIPSVLWLLLFFYYANTSGFTPRHLIPILLPIAILGGMGAGFLVRKVKRSPLQAVAGLFVILAVCGYGIHRSYPLIDFRKDYCGPKEMAEFVRANTEPDATVITMDESVYIRYYAEREVMSHPLGDYAANRDFVEGVRKMSLSGRRFYVNSTAFSYDPMKHFERLMTENFHFLCVGEVMDEQFLRPELEFKTCSNKLFRLYPR